MKIETMRSSIFSHLRHTPYIGIVTLAWVFTFSVLTARAGNIFDDDWTPPKSAAQPHAAPAQPPPVAPIPRPPATNPAAAPSPSPQPAPEPQLAPPPQPPSRRAIPGKLEQARSRGLLKEAFAGQLKDRSIAGRRKLAQALLDEVPKTADSPSDEYVLLGGAIEASKDAGALGLCFQAADTMASQYEVDGLSIKTDAALKVNLRGDSPAAAAENVQAALALIDPLLAGEDFSTAAKILATVRPAAASDPALASAVQKQLHIVENLRAAHSRVAASAEKLKTSPDDPAANLAVGTYLCFSRGEWENGLVMLTRGSDLNLKQVASLELSRPKTADDVIRLADRWWDAAPKQPDTSRPAIRQHAAFFYKLALESETGLRRTVLEHRIAEAAADHPAAGRMDPPDKIVNLLKLVKIDRDMVSGEWAYEGGVLSVKAASRPIMRIQMKPDKAYELRVEYQQLDGGVGGEAAFGVHLPVADSGVVLMVSTPYMGLDMVDGKVWGDNETLKHGHFGGDKKKHTLDIAVWQTRPEARILVQFDGKLQIDWSGPPSSLTIYGPSAFPPPMSLGLLAVNAPYVVSGFALKDYGDAEPPPPGKKKQGK